VHICRIVVLLFFLPLPFYSHSCPLLTFCDGSGLIRQSIASGCRCRSCLFWSSVGRSTASLPPFLFILRRIDQMIDRKWPSLPLLVSLLFFWSSVGHSTASWPLSFSFCHESIRRSIASGRPCRFLPLSCLFWSSVGRSTASLPPFLFILRKCDQMIDRKWPSLPFLVSLLFILELSRLFNCLLAPFLFILPRIDQMIHRKWPSTSVAWRRQSRSCLRSKSIPQGWGWVGGTVSSQLRGESQVINK